jgi:pyruvate/2-oxoglutarate/acetoin dehydrogenase E1 component
LRLTSYELSEKIMFKLTYRDAVGKALEDSMREEPRLILIGQNIAAHALKVSPTDTVSSECAIPRSARAPWWEWRLARR